MSATDLSHDLQPNRAIAGLLLDPLLEQAATEVVRRRLETPAILLLEMHRPLTFLGSQALVLFTPMLAPAFGVERLERITALLEDRRNLDLLLNRMEELAAQRDAVQRADAGSVAP